MAHVTEITVKLSDKTPEFPDGKDWQIVRNADKEPQDFSQGAGGKYVYVFYKTGTGKGISALRFIHDATPVPSGWTKLDVGFSKNRKRTFLCYQESSDFACISSLKAGYGKSVGNAMDDFSQGDIIIFQDTNEGDGGKFIFLGYSYTDS